MSTYSAILLDHIQYPRNVGELQADDSVGTGVSSALGRLLSFFIRVESGQIIEARFRSSGCSFILACGSALTELTIGRSISECQRLEAADLESALDGLPPHKSHCADFAINALRNALNRFAVQRNCVAETLSSSPPDSDA